MKIAFPYKRNYLSKKLTCRFAYFSSLGDSQKLVNHRKKGDFFIKLKNTCPSNEEIERTKGINIFFNDKKGEEITKLYLKIEATCVFERFIKASVNKFDINPLYCVRSPGFTWLCGLEYTDYKLQTVQDEKLILLIENNMRRGILSNG